MEGHRLPKLQVLSLPGFGVGTNPQHSGKGSAGVNTVQGEEPGTLTVEMSLHVLSRSPTLSANTAHLLVPCAKLLFPVGVSERHRHLPNIIPLLKTEKTKNINMWQPVLTKYKLVYDQCILSVLSLKTQINV